MPEPTLRLWRAAFAAALFGSLVIALWPPGPPGEDWFDQADKLRHAVGFLVLWLLGERAAVARAATLGLGLLAFGVLIEWLQSFTPLREPSVGDVVADAAGLVVGALISRFRAA